MTTAPVVLTAETFAPHVGQTFRIEGAPFALSLNAIERTSPVEEVNAFRAPFTLLFSGPPGQVLAEGLRRIEAEDGKAYALYLMPIHTPAAGRQDYQAVFN